MQLAFYPFNESLRTSTDEEPNSVASSFVNSNAGTESLFNPGISTGRGNSAPAIQINGTNTNGPSGNTTTTESGVVNNADYFVFSIAPSAGYALQLTDLTFDYASFGTNQTNAIYFVRSSLDNYATTIASTGFLSAIPATYTTAVLALSSLPAVEQEVTFRLYVGDNRGVGDAGTVMDNVTLNGQVAAVPEPATAGLAVCGGVAILLRRRRH
jgi:hypothetical protein